MGVGVVVELRRPWHASSPAARPERCAACGRWPCGCDDPEPDPDGGLPRPRRRRRRIAVLNVERLERAA